MGARVYDPYTGTFTQPDPIQGGGATPYGYTDGDPVNETDLGGESVVGRPMCGWNGQNYEASRCGGPTLSDVAQVLTWATLPLALVDPAGDAADVADATVIVRGGTSDVPSAGEAFSGARGSTPWKRLPPACRMARFDPRRPETSEQAAGASAARPSTMRGLAR